MTRFSHLGLCAVLLACGAPTVATPSEAEAEIDWRPWSPEVFAEARRTGRLVFVNGSIEGCMACRWMEATSYRHPAVRARLNAHFLSVTVDADAQPDVGQRFERWGWPALVFLTGEGQVVHAIRGNRQPRNFLPILDALIAAEEAGTLETGSPLHGERVPAPTPLAQGCREVQAEMQRREQPLGGWGAQTIVRGPPVRTAWLRAQARHDPALHEAGLRTAQAYAGLIDEVGGGMFLETTDAAWTEILYEKRTRQEAEAIRVFVDAFRATGDAAWLRRAQIVGRHLRETMRRTDGAFYTYQEDHTPGWREPVAAYFALSEPERQAVGAPPIDRTVYTDVNANAIEALALWSMVSGEPAPGRMALEAAEAMLRERGQPEGWLLHVTPGEGADDRMVALVRDGRMHLRSQARFGIALLALHRLTGDVAWRARAVRLAAAMESLFDRRLQVYRSASPDGTDAVLGTEWSVRENAVAARFLLELGAETHEVQWEERAEVLLTHITPEGRALRRLGMHALGELALAHERASLSPLELTVVGPPENGASRALFRAAQQVPELGASVRFQADERYPEADVPVLYACTRQVCSRPVREPARVAEVAEELGSSRAEGCSTE